MNRLMLLASHNFSRMFRFLATAILKSIFCFAEHLTTTIGEDVFNVADNFFKDNMIDWVKCFSVCADGGLSVTECRQSFVPSGQRIA